MDILFFDMIFFFSALSKLRPISFCWECILCCSEFSVLPIVCYLDLSIIWPLLSTMPDLTRLWNVVFFSKNLTRWKSRNESYYVGSFYWCVIAVPSSTKSDCLLLFFYFIFLLMSFWAIDGDCFSQWLDSGLSWNSAFLKAFGRSFILCNAILPETWVSIASVWVISLLLDESPSIIF